MTTIQVSVTAFKVVSKVQPFISTLNPASAYVRKLPDTREASQMTFCQILPDSEQLQQAEVILGLNLNTKCSCCS